MDVSVPVNEYDPHSIEFFAMPRAFLPSGNFVKIGRNDLKRVDRNVKPLNISDLELGIRKHTVCNPIDYSPYSYRNILSQIL